MKYQVILADPPWDYDNRVQHGGAGVGYTSGAEAFYPTLTMADLVRLPVKSLADKKSILFMWVTGPQWERAIELCKAWGFKFKTVAFVWNKVMVNPGYYTMSQVEYCIAAVRGGIPKPRGARNVRQYICERRTAHSAKPSEVRRRIDLMFPELRKVELFARERADGWDAWGNEVDSSPSVARALETGEAVS